MPLKRPLPCKGQKWQNNHHVKMVKNVDETIRDLKLETHKKIVLMGLMLILDLTFSFDC